MSRLIPLVAVLALASGCVVQPPGYVRYDGPAPEGSYAETYANRDTRSDVDVEHGAVPDDRAYANSGRDDDRGPADGYANDDQRAGDDEQRGDYDPRDNDQPDNDQPGDYDDDAAGYADVPDYIEYPAYYSSLWPVYGSYYYPYASPYFYPGITFFPSGFYGAGYGGFGWGLGLSFGFGFSPWRSAYWDNYYNWGYWRHNYPHYAHFYPNHHFGSARNEARFASNHGGGNGHGFAGANSHGSHLAAASLPRWGGQRASGVNNNSRFTQGNGVQRSAGFAGMAGMTRNGSASVNGNRAGPGNAYGNARYGTSALPSASYRDQVRGGSQGAGMNNRADSASLRGQNSASALQSRSQYSGAAQNYSGQRSGYRSQSNYYGNANGYRGGASASRQSRYGGGYMPHDYASPKADHSAAPRGYMSNSRGSFQGPYGGGSSARGGVARSSTGHSSGGAAHSAASSSHGGGGHEGGHSH